MSLPGQFDFRIGHLGRNLSGGQCQRIAIAQALFSNKPILVLDEATSALDPSTRTQIINNIFDHYPTTKKIIVAHDLSLISRCDSVIQTPLQDNMPHS